MVASKKTISEIHLIGVGGIGMSALARYFLAFAKASRSGQKWTVSGSDAVRSPMTDELIKEGVRVKIGHKKATVGPKTGLVIYNRAIATDNPEMVAARRLKVPIVAYAQALGKITQSYETIAITGSHGKSTTTALVGLTLMHGDLDPTILIGTKLNELKGKNIRVGRGQYLVLEADDFGAAFTAYSPAIAIITNIDREHMDFYKTFGNVKKHFMKFLENTREGGTLILNKDDKPLASLKKQIVTLAKKKDLRVVWYSLKDGEAKKIARVIKIPGKHNISNALAVWKLAQILKINEKNILAAIGAYNGAWRRMEYKGVARAVSPSKMAVKVYDDYAHHPTEIKATLQGFREKFPRSPLVCVFQPHQAQRLELLFKEFTHAFDDADVIVLLPLYKVLGRHDEKLPHDAKALAIKIQKRLPKKWVVYVNEPKQLKQTLKNIFDDMPVSGKGSHVETPVLIMMGAGDIVDHTKTLLK